jgi:succinate dehydrogenase / fumarate reductase iron-sulfur subunit
MPSSIQEDLRETRHIPKKDADRSMDAAACIGCGACVAACPNASASLFTAAKITHFGTLPQCQPERDFRALRMVSRINQESFGQRTTSVNAKPCARKASRSK